MCLISKNLGFMVDKLAKLQALLDSGVLSQEEFDTAKRRILEGADSLPQQGQVKPPPFPFEKAQPSPNKHLKWIIFGVIGAVVVIVGVVIAVLSLYSGSSEQIDSYDLSEQIPTDTIAYVCDYQEETDNGVSLFNPWRKDFLHNEWGEDDPNYPYLYTVLDGTSWNIQLDYMPPRSEADWESFRFYLLDRDGHITSSYAPVNILIRGSDGETKFVEVTGTRDGITFVEDPTTVEALKYYLDHESFDIRMEFGKYNERHATQSRWECHPGSFQEAIDKFL